MLKGFVSNRLIDNAVEPSRRHRRKVLYAETNLVPLSIINEELDDFLYGMNLLADLMCELCNQVATKHQWNAKASTAFTTMLELARDTLGQMYTRGCIHT